MPRPETDEGLIDTWRIYGLRRWKLLRRAILNASNWRCEVCGALAIEVHHIQPIRNGGAPFDAANCEAICRACHLSEHRGGTFVSKDRREWQEYLRAQA